SHVSLFTHPSASQLYTLSLHDALPISTTGLSLLSVRFRKYAVSSIVSVPCVITMPSTSGCLSSSETRLASLIRRSLLKLSEPIRSEEHTSELQSRRDLVCRLLLEKKKK